MIFYIFIKFDNKLKTKRRYFFWQLFLKNSIVESGKQILTLVSGTERGISPKEINKKQNTVEVGNYEMNLFHFF